MSINNFYIFSFYVKMLRTPTTIFLHFVNMKDTLDVKTLKQKSTVVKKNNEVKFHLN